jgi:DNA-binding LytR/AlgR family response regulator
MVGPTAILAEDEPLLRGELKEALAALWPELTILAEASDGWQAAQGLGTHHPDVIFLDIEMPGMSGLDVARSASGKCHVVFVTAYDQYAVEAFERGAVDYVMKPFSPTRLAMAVNRVKERMSDRPAKLENVLDSLAERSPKSRTFLRWISLAQGRTVRLVTVDRILYFQADNKYTLVVTDTLRSLISRPIRELVSQLDPDMFLQIHRGTVVNVNAIEAVHRDFRGRLEVRLKERDKTLPVSATYAHHFRNL